MRSLALLALIACGEPHGSVRAAGIATDAGPFPASHWIPAHPTYVVVARTVPDAQRAMRDVIDSFGAFVGVTPAGVSEAFQRLLAVDALSADAVAAIGVDLDGGWAVFSEDVEPTLVLRLASSDALDRFLESQRKRGMNTRSQMIDGVEVSRVDVGLGTHVSWAVDRAWLWVHVGFGKTDDSWFTHSHHPQSPEWRASWDWATAHSKGNVTGFISPRDILAGVAQRVPGAVACAQLVQPVARVAVGFDGDLHRAGMHFAFDIGDAVRPVESAILAPPAGWAAAAADAPLAFAWNVDIPAIATWLDPCVRVLGVDLPSQAQSHGVRTARVLLQTFDPDGPKGTGLAVMDLSSAAFLRDQLDRIPLRSHFESDRMFGTHKGKRLSIPFKFSIDYVLDDHLAMFAMGDGMLDKVDAGTTNPASLFALDLAPPKLSGEAWAYLLDAAGIWQPRRVAEQLLLWHDLKISLGVDGQTLALEATGNRR